MQVIEIAALHGAAGDGGALDDAAREVHDPQPVREVWTLLGPCIVPADAYVFSREAVADDSEGLRMLQEWIALRDRLPEPARRRVRLASLVGPSVDVSPTQATADAPAFA